MIEARFFSGPLDGTTRDVVTVFAAIDVYEPQGEYDPSSLALFDVVLPAKSVWNYVLSETDYDTYATYNGTQVNNDTYVTVDAGTWTAASRNFDVLSDVTTDVLVTPTDITFLEYGVTVRLAQRQGE